MRGRQLRDERGSRVAAAADRGRDRRGRRTERIRVRPQFNSTRYGTPTYCQLAADWPAEIVRGADDESEMGVFHDLFQPQREANLRARLDEFVPAARRRRASSWPVEHNEDKDHERRFLTRYLRPHQHFSRVLQQQGRVHLDADWNEQTAILCTTCARWRPI